MGFLISMNILEFTLALFFIAYLAGLVGALTGLGGGGNSYPRSCAAI